MSGYYDDEGYGSDDSQPYEPREQFTRDTKEQADIEALRREVEDLKALLTESPDSSVEVAIEDNRRAIQHKADRAANAVKAASDPATLEKLNGLDTEEAVMDFLRQNGMDG